MKKHALNSDVLDWDKSFFVLISSFLGSLDILSQILPMIIFLSRDSELQEKIHTELQIKVPEDEELVAPSIAKDLLYIQACIMETSRLIGEPAIPHVSTKNLTIKGKLVYLFMVCCSKNLQERLLINCLLTFTGFKIPEGSVVLINLPRIHRSAKYWDRPNEFWPERFLKFRQDGTLELEKFANLIPFGLGPRSCPGYGLHKVLSGMLIANLIREFYIIPDESSKKSLGPSYDLTLEGEIFAVEFRKRATEFFEKTPTLSRT